MFASRRNDSKSISARRRVSSAYPHGMRCLALLLPCLLACSSVDPVGTYSVTGKLVSGDCPVDSTAQTWTISKPGEKFLIEFPGITGGCPLETVGGDAAKLQGKCEFAIQGVAQKASTQFSLDFTDAGFTGTTANFVPKVPSVPALANGCTGTTTADGKRL